MNPILKVLAALLVHNSDSSACPLGSFHAPSLDLLSNGRLGRIGMAEKKINGLGRCCGLLFQVWP